VLHSNIFQEPLDQLLIFIVLYKFSNRLAKAV